MKKFLLTLGLLGITTLSHAQGTIAFRNSALTRVKVYTDNPARNATAADGIKIGVWYGSSPDSLQQAPGTATIGNTAGVMLGAAPVYALPGTEAGQTVALQIRAWNDLGWCGVTDVRQVTLGLTAGPGAVIWQTASATHPNRFTPLIVSLGGGICIPEPSTLALGALFGAFLLFRFRAAGARSRTSGGICSVTRSVKE